MKENIESLKAIRFVDSQTFQPKIRVRLDMTLEQIQDNKIVFSQDEIYANIGRELFDKIGSQLEKYNSKLIALSLIPDNLEGDYTFAGQSQAKVFDKSYLNMKQVFKPRSEGSGDNFECKTYKTKISLTEEIINKILTDDQATILQLVKDIQEEFITNNGTHFYYAMISSNANPDTMNIDYVVLVRGIISNEKGK
jgi:hypothetical protein